MRPANRHSPRGLSALRRPATGREILAGIGAAVLAYLLGWYLAGQPRTPWITYILLWPLVLLGLVFRSRCPTPRPGQLQFCEGTPIDLLAAGLGLAAGAVCYGWLTCRILVWRRTRHA